MSFERRFCSVLICLTLMLASSYGFIQGINEANEMMDEWPADDLSPMETLSFWADEEEEETTDSPNACCLPKTWQGTIFSAVKRGGERSNELSLMGEGKKPKPKVIRSKVKAYVDQNNKRVREDVTIPKGRGKNATTISNLVLFNSTGATLYVFSSVSMKCFAKHFKNATFQSQCLPTNSTMRGSFSLGAGARALKAQAWSFRVHDKRVCAAGTAVVTPGNCIPVMIQEKVSIRKRFSEDDDKPKPKPKSLDFEIGQLFINVQASITDPSVFQKPSYCNDTSNTLLFLPDVDLTEILYRYVSLE